MYVATGRTPTLRDIVPYESRTIVQSALLMQTYVST